ncbi:hypothetical protein A3D03_04660 [Candidatus Gottesmanbacteria bacterium RIFCSPHIGHO2_02_FULL_40_13]|uniref:TNase-like domain-containing protein n=1 Tax=Candidatus Gottesmanbacteria bacterium RIFCSPHIGHO2_02_FULL_40_13 TaxID=1798384 RepID=A0A1F6ACS8_9BACT|nr:MAG: hypothetical protein A3D03_04660 [Candidatus Gottesmanbacteria bacterium RIFCSPHIGHO2_02_FULL_40_13]
MIKLKKSWLIILLSFFLLSLILNLVFIYDSWHRNIVVKVVDGDSLDLADGRRIRLLGIDTPEKENCMYDQARAFLQKLASGKHVRLKNSVKDSYGRLLANVIVEDFPVWINYLNWRYFSNKSLHPYPDPDPYLNRGLIVAGLARDTGSKILKQAEIFSKDRQLGIWSGECIQLAPANSDCQIKGNIRQDVKSYYLPDCPNYQQVIVNTAYGDNWFCSVDEATKAGFSKSPGCR